MMPVVWSDRHRLHEPGGEVWVGVRTPGTEVPERAERILAALADAPRVEAREHGDEVVLAVHDRELVEYLAGAWEAWEAAGLPNDRVVPYIFPRDGGRRPAATHALAGWFAYDTMTLVGPGTYEAARAAVDAAVTAADLVLEGAPAAYALTRPPGHHVTRDAFGGSCYLNNSAAAAARLTRAGRVAVLDVDAHHGNGTQAIFAQDDRVLTGSVHVDPGAGWFPHFSGFADESHATNRNVTLAPGTTDEAWVAAVEGLTHWAEGVDALVIALGVDAAGGDPESPLDVTHEGFREAGRTVGAMGLPTVVVQEGGYELDTIGGLVRVALEGIEEGRDVGRDR